VRGAPSPGPGFGLPRAWWRWTFFACLAVVLVLSLLPPRVPMPSTGWDKMNHALAFAVLAVLGCRSYPRLTLGVLPGLLAYGGLIELLQGMTDYRSAEWLDMLADGVGLLSGWVFLRLVFARTSAHP
jgi:VanZ family protein